jgi:hypothetical protein
VVPLFQSTDPEDGRVEEAVSAAEEFGAANTAANAARAAKAARDVARPDYGVGRFSPADFAIASAVCAAAAADAPYVACAYFSTIDAVYCAASAAAVHQAMADDLNLLRSTAAKEHWTDATPVPPEFFGPLWPDGPPEEWPTRRK